VDGDQNPRKSGDMEKIGTRLAAGHRRILPSNSWRRRRPVVSPCQDRQPPESVAECQTLQGDAIGLTSAAEFIGVCPGEREHPRRAAALRLMDFAGFRRLLIAGNKPRKARFSSAVSSRSVFARRCSRETAMLFEWIT
jgi:hypothetical protein